MKYSHVLFNQLMNTKYYQYGIYYLILNYIMLNAFPLFIETQNTRINLQCDAEPKYKTGR